MSAEKRDWLIKVCNPSFVPLSVRLCLPKIISGRNGGAARTRSEWPRWHRFAGPPDPGARLCPRLSVCGPHCSTQHKKKGFAAGAPRRRSAPGPGTRGARCQSDAPHMDFAMETLARSVADAHRPHPGLENMSVGTVIVAHQVARR